MAKSHSGKILIIDDTQENIALLVEILQKKGYHISAASSGERGIVIAEKIKPDLILLDIMMPGIDAYETCIKLKNQKKTKKIIDAHHGKIWLENYPDGGVLSCFIIPNQQNE